MSSPSSTQDPDERILADFIAELEKRGIAALDEYVLRYPHLADRMRGLVGMHDAIEGARDDRDESVPERLGDFRIVRLIARGGMGEVYEAVQEHLGRRVAIKVIRRGRVSEQARERFLREQQVLARLHQTHIVPIHFAGEEGRLQYFVMPYIEGSALHHLVQAAQQLDSTQTGDRTPTLAELAVRGTPDSADAAKGSEDVPDTINPREEEFPSREAKESPPLGLSPAYFRSVAVVMADAAEAVQHAHGDGILHRDLKPSNIMVDRQGQCWLIDFGLAAFVREATTPTGSGKETRNPEPMTASSVAGTVEYMSPEQLDGKVDVRTDVWGLGATLYELLTLSRPFDAPAVPELCVKIRTGEPAAPRRVVVNVPRDLEAICLKALRKGPGQRYQKAGEFAADLRRWLRHEPTTARPLWGHERVWLWTRRNKGWAAAIAVGLICAALLAWVGIRYEQHRADIAEAEATAAEVKAKAAEAEAAAAVALAQRQHRELLGVELERKRLRSHEVGWRKDALGLVREIAKISTDDELRNQAAAVLHGLDARPLKPFRKIVATSLAFDKEGQRLLMGDGDGTGAKLWDGTINEPISSGQPGPGPVAFRPDGTPWQIAWKDRWTYVVWDVAKRQLVRELTVPGRGDRKREPGELWPSMAVTPDGSFFAASPDLPGGKKLIAVWDTASGKLIHEFAEKATGLAFSPVTAEKKGLLAAGHEDGRITLWALPTGEKIATLSIGRTQVNALAFGRDLRRRAEAKVPAPELDGWLLAVGQADTKVTIWDLGKQRLISFCHGSSEDVHTVAFSPDGTTLASAGRGLGRLWDVRTGRLLLSLESRNYTFALTFSPDGKRLAAASAGAFGYAGGVDVWQLEPGQGMQQLRGLTAQVERAHFSADGRLLAALSHGWELAVWERKSGRLLHLLEAPVGPFSDNADFAFNADGSRLAFASGRQAKMWNLTTGRALKTWDLPPGLGNQLAFHSSGKLLLFRWETEDGQNYPLSNVPWQRHPRVCQLRNLLGPKPEEPIRTIKDFNRYIFCVRGSSDGKYFVVEGIGGADGRSRKITVFDGPTGAERWSISIKKTHDGSTLLLDPRGHFLAFQPDDDSRRAEVVELATGKLLRILKPLPSCLAPGLKHSVHGNEIWLYRRGDDERDDDKPQVKLGIDTPLKGGCEFDATGTHLAWGSVDGTVMLCDLEEVQRRLAAIGLGW